MTTTPVASGSQSTSQRLDARGFARFGDKYLPDWSRTKYYSFTDQGSPWIGINCSGHGD